MFGVNCSLCQGHFLKKNHLKKTTIFCKMRINTNAFWNKGVIVLGIIKRPLFIFGLILFLLLVVLQFSYNVSSGYMFVLAISSGLSIGVSVDEK